MLKSKNFSLNNFLIFCKMGLCKQTKILIILVKFVQSSSEKYMHVNIFAKWWCAKPKTAKFAPTHQNRHFKIFWKKICGKSFCITHWKIHFKEKILGQLLRYICIYYLPPVREPFRPRGPVDALAFAVKLDLLWDTRGRVAAKVDKASS